MGLTDRRKMAKNLVDSRKNWKIVIFNFLKQKKLIFNVFVNRNWLKLTDTRIKKSQNFSR